MPILSWISDGLGMIVGFIVCLIPLILVHELGHFFMARLIGVWAREFGIGYPPRIVKLFTWRETDFTLNWLPLGGFTRLEGEQTFAEDEEEDGEVSPEVQAEREEAYRHSLYAQPPGKRILLYLGGPVMNLLTAWVLATLLFTTGLPIANVVISEVAAESPAAEADMQVGDVIVAVNGEVVESIDEVAASVQQTLGEPTEILMEREGQELTVSLIPRADPPEGQGAMGVLISEVASGKLKHYPLGQAFIYGSRYLGRIIGATVLFPVYVIRGLIPIEQARPVGPIGISQIAQHSVETSISTGAAYPLLNILILVSVSLGMFNLLPIPALDGGRILFAIVEKIRHKPLTPALEERIHMVTLMVLGAIFIIITVLDVVAPVQLP
ncbi:MAG: site-2 protease family protein [Anaerolineae bacterium]|nr:site-2 protease family protein [Anaerolineae bacterium]